MIPFNHIAFIAFLLAQSQKASETWLEIQNRNFSSFSHRQLLLLSPYFLTFHLIIGVWSIVWNVCRVKHTFSFVRSNQITACFIAFQLCEAIYQFRHLHTNAHESSINDAKASQPAEFSFNCSLRGLIRFICEVKENQQERKHAGGKGEIWLEHISTWVIAGSFNKILLKLTRKVINIFESKTNLWKFNRKCMQKSQSSEKHKKNQLFCPVPVLKILKPPRGFKNLTVG